MMLTIQPGEFMPTFRTSDGVHLSYTEQGYGQPVVLIHGFTAPAAAWALTTDALVASGYRVIAFDRR
jgi:non-heme chloroperoxidase